MDADPICYCATPAEGERGRRLLEGERLDTQRGPPGRHESVEACLRAWVVRQTRGLSAPASVAGIPCTARRNEYTVVVARYRVGALVKGTRSDHHLRHLQTVGHFEVYAGWAAVWREPEHNDPQETP